MAEPLTQKAGLSVGEPLGLLSRRSTWRWPRTWGLEPAVAVIGVVGAVAVLWVTLRADFLAHPGWLAVQKADFVLGPIGVGLYWMHRRPTNRFGLLLVVLGLLGIPYILESSSNPTLFAIGVVAEDPIWIMTTIVIFAFPTGRLERLERLTVALLAVTALVVVVVTVSVSHLAPGLSISECRDACPGSRLGLSEWQIPSVVIGTLPLVIGLATAGLVGWRFATGTPPRRRALAIGTPIALLFLFAQAAQQVLFLISPDGRAGNARPIQDVVQWTLAGTRSLIWYGFLFALVAAELQAGRVLKRLVHESLGRPSFRELEGLLRGPLGDPGLRLGFWHTATHGWVASDGEGLEPRPGQVLTVVDRDGSPAAAIVHDAQLSEDPELLQAAGAAALLVQENTELDAAWKESLNELSDSRARLVQAGDRERRKLERDLHDGAQQRLLAVLLTLTTAKDMAADNGDLMKLLTRAEGETDEAIDDLRELAHGIYPTVLADHGLAGGLRALATRLPGTITIAQATSRRLAPEIETAIYYCCLEAVQNTTKHAGPDAHITIRLHADLAELHLEVRDDGPGFDPTNVPAGLGLQSMRDRLGAVGGHTEIVSRPGHGTVVKATVPIREVRQANQPHRLRQREPASLARSRTAS
jgi:signal transduction histidine kinase